jgi:hypothetical protein
METHEENQLKGALNWQYKPRRTESNLGDEIFSYLKQHDRTFVKNAVIVDLWNQIIPPGLQPFCRLDKRVGNTLYVQAQPGAYMHQLQMLSDELLDRIRQCAPRSGIQKIRIIPLRKENQE